MANEAVCIETPTEFARFTIADSTIPLNTLMQLSDPNTVAASSGADVWGGINWLERNSDGTLETTCAMNGVWDLTNTNEAITVGATVSLSGANLIKTATEAEEITGNIIGKALETAAAGEVIRVRVGRTT